MTAPGGDGTFDYTDDSVIARVAIEVPSQALTDITQLSSAMGAMQTQLEAVARSQADWVEYLKQIPQLTQDTNEAIKAQITLLERQSYLQNEISGGRGGTFTGTAGGGGALGGGGGGYSTAAPAGYAQPWQAGAPGTGMAPSPVQMAEKAERIRSEDPALMESMQQQRGLAVNPVLLGGAGAAATAIGRRLGLGKPDGGNASPQKTGGDRKSSSPANPDLGGAPIESEDADTPGDPNENAPDDFKMDVFLTQLANDFKGGKNGRIMRMGQTILGAASSIFGGGAATGPAAGSSGLLGGLMKKVGGLSPGVKAAGGIGLGLAGFNAVQGLGEKYTEFQQLGSVQGGDAATGMKYEAQARIMALNPFITTQQARQAMQMALKEGFRGDNYDTVQDFMISNFKDLGVSMGQSMDIMKSQVKGLSETDDGAGVKNNLEETMNLMKELSANGGASLPERINQLEQLSGTMSGLGFSPENATRTAVGLQEGYGDSRALKDSIGRIGGEVMGSDMLMTLAAQKAGLTGHLPAALPTVLDRAGFDGDEIVELAASEVAGYVTGFPDKVDRIANFMTLMGQYGVNMDFPEAEAMYNKVTGEEKPTAKANRVVSRQGKTKGGGGGMASRGGGGSASSNPADAEWNAKHQNYSPSENAAGMSENFDAAGRGAGYGPGGQPSAPLPTAAAPVPTFSSDGTVTGTVTIVVDRQGNVTAPAAIQLTGQQKAALAGYGSAQMNNAPPGDPTSNHAFNSFPAPGGGQ